MQSKSVSHSLAHDDVNEKALRDLFHMITYVMTCIV
jgi:hypothetical protein